MSLFDEIVDEALRSRADLSSLRPVVEKELLHHDILREMSEAGLLTGLTFIGGTCLRACYGSPRLSEDLNFTGGSHFQHGDLAELGSILTERLRTRYDLPVRVSKPVKTGGNVSTWKLIIETRPGQKHLPRDAPFPPRSLVGDTLERDSYWAYLTRGVTESGRKAVEAL